MNSMKNFKQNQEIDQIPDNILQVTTQDNNTPVVPLSKLNISSTQKIALSGALAGFVAGVSVCPLDVAKTRLQAQGLNPARGKYNGIIGTLSTIVRDEGVPGLYKGLVPIILGYFPTWMIYFSVYENAKQFYPQFNKKNFNLDNEFLNNSMSAFTAGSVSTTLTNPIWVVKTRLMLQTGDGSWSLVSQQSNPERLNKFYYKNTIDAFRKMYKYEGFQVFYSGLVPSLFGLFHVAIHFPVYEKLKKIFHCNDLDQTKSQKLFRLIMASSLSKMCASTLTYPHEILRTRMQIRSMTTHLKKDEHLSIFKLSDWKKGDLISTILKIYQKEGLIGFYSGFTTNLARTVPASAVTLVSFEYISRYLSHH